MLHQFPSLTRSWKIGAVGALSTACEAENARKNSHTEVRAAVLTKQSPLQASQPQAPPVRRAQKWQMHLCNPLCLSGPFKLDKAGLTCDPVRCPKGHRTEILCIFSQITCVFFRFILYAFALPQQFGEDFWAFSLLRPQTEVGETSSGCSGDRLLGVH